MPQPPIYLDIETTGFSWSHGDITVLGFETAETGLVQLIGSDITRKNLLAVLPASGQIVTYNGRDFDLRWIEAKLGVNLHKQYESHDLRWICQHNGLMGGLKVVERVAGYRRKLKGVDGREAVNLWWDYVDGNQNALERLRSYNAEDIAALASVHSYVVERQWL